MKKRILIIGGAGFIGINTVKASLDAGHSVTILDNLSRKGTPHNMEWLKKTYPDGFAFVKADIRHDQDVLDREVQKHDAVIHLAAQVAVTTSVVDPRTDFDINALGTLNILEAIRASENKPFLIYASTNKVYGGLEDIPLEEKETRYTMEEYTDGIPETYPLDFHSPYGCSKGAADQYVRDYARIYGLKTVVFRQSCIYGYHQYGVEDQGWIAWFIIALLTGKPITIYGDGKQVRDVLFVSDLTRLYLAAIDNMDAVSGKAYNVGGGKDNSLSLLEFLDMLKNDHGVPVSYDMDKTRPGDQKIFISDNSALLRDIGWQPEVGTKEGIAHILSWVKEHLKEIKQLYG